MIRRILLHCAGSQRIAVFKGKNRLVLGAVILVHAADVLQQRHSPDEQQEQRDADDAIHQVEHDLLAEHRVHALQFRGRQPAAGTCT